MSTNANFFNENFSVRGLLNPKAGTKPFWTRANESPENQVYDSEDDYTTDTRKLPNFDPDTGEQVDKPLDTPDTRFVLQSYEPPVVDRQNRNVKVKNADTIISLLPEDDDYILIREDIMCKSHRFFEAGFRDLWSSKELDTEVDVDGCTIKYRYELEFHDDGTTSLNGKSSATPPVERTQNMQNAQNAVEENTVNNEVAQDMFDEYWLRLRFGANIMQHVNALRGHEYEFVCKAAHYLGFELLCGYPTKTCSRVIHNSPSDGFRGSRGFRSESQAKILIILKLVEWIHAYASFTVLEPQVERLILHSKFSEVAWEYPHTTLRITKLIKGEELFRLTLPHVVCNFDDPITDREPEFAAFDLDDEVELAEGDISVDKSIHPTTFRLMTRMKIRGHLKEKPSQHWRSPKAKPLSSRRDDAIRERRRYYNLEEQLGHDQVLAYHVTRMHAITSKPCNAAFREFYAVIDRVEIELEHRNVAAMTAAV